MRAWNFYSSGDWSLEKINDPKPAADEVVVRIKVVQPSISEVVARGLGDSPLTSRMQQLLSQQSPRQLFGHEFSGEVVSAGSGVRKLRVGDRVACLHSSLGCGECSFCSNADFDFCQERRSIGFEMPGCFAEYASIPEFCLARLPAEVDDHEGATLQPLGHCMTTVECANIQPTDTLVILGQGVLGLGMLQIARSRGVGNVLTTDIRSANVELSEKLGAHHALRAGSANTEEVIREVTKGRGADVVIDTAGGSAKFGLSGQHTLQQAVELARPGGTVVVPALIEGQIPIDMSLLSSRGLHIIWPGELFQGSEKHLLELMQQRRVITKPTIRKTVKGLKKVPEAFRITGDKQRYETINPCQVVV